MNDTSSEMLKKQFEIVAMKTMEERINGLFEMTELSRQIIQNRIISANPEITDIELRIETFKTFYHQDFNGETMRKIVSSMKQHFLQNPE